MVAVRKRQYVKPESVVQLKNFFPHAILANSKFAQYWHLISKDKGLRTLLNGGNFWTQLHRTRDINHSQNNMYAGDLF